MDILVPDFILKECHQTEMCATWRYLYGNKLLGLLGGGNCGFRTLTITMKEHCYSDLNQVDLKSTSCKKRKKLSPTKKHLTFSINSLVIFFNSYLKILIYITLLK